MWNVFSSGNCQGKLKEAAATLQKIIVLEDWRHIFMLNYSEYQTDYDSKVKMDAESKICIDK